MMELGAVLETMQQEDCPDRLCQALVSFSESQGYEHVIYSLLSDHASIGQPAQHGVISTYPEAWVEHYIDHHYLEHDPVVRMGRAIRWPFIWSEALNQCRLSPLEKHILREGREAGLADGICMTVEYRPGEIAGLALATSDPALLSNTRIIPQLFIAFQQMHRRFCDIQGAGYYPAIPQLSDREAEILQWMAKGKSQLDIGEILGIHKSTVQTYTTRIMEKLGTPNPMMALVMAAKLGLVTPEMDRAQSPYRRKIASS